MTPLARPTIPEPPRVDTLGLLAPKFREAIERVLVDMRDLGHGVRVFETLRTDARQAYLYGFGRDYDDGRGPVTKVPSARGGWHFYGLAADIVEDDASPWKAPNAFWQDLGRCGERHGLTWGGRWKMLDLPHLQWGKCRVSPPRHLQYTVDMPNGLEEIWRQVGAA